MSPDDLILKKVEMFANNAHGAQTRRYTPDPYIVHPIRVMEKCRLFLPQLAVLSAALLHDVLEDTPVTKNQLEDFLDGVMTSDEVQKTIRYVVELTDIYTKKDYPRLNRRKRREMEFDRLSEVSAEAQTIKYADIIDNTDITENDPDFAKVYLREAQSLLQKMTNGNAILREEAIETVEACLKRLKQPSNANDRTVQIPEKS
jgi:guanosine-3',5'-bis(diphosphate) 3'-pyrophosphohydrolase